MLGTRACHQDLIVSLRTSLELESMQVLCSLCIGFDYAS